ncbi:hypothetical protein V2I01_20260 [Micromonospora sp. BRA006-A]|nr:hypothetical protein [Micromonospora sp. BRA006-A]
MLPAALAGCGIPDETDVQVDGSAPAAESGVLNGSPARPPEPADSASRCRSWRTTCLQGRRGRRTRPGVRPGPQVPRRGGRDLLGQAADQRDRADGGAAAGEAGEHAAEHRAPAP